MLISHDRNMTTTKMLKLTLPSSFFILLNLSENYFHKSQTNKYHGNVNGGNIHTSSAGVNDMIFLPFRYSIPDTPYSVPAAVGTSELSSLVNQILKGTQSYVNKLVLIQGQDIFKDTHSTVGQTKTVKKKSLERQSNHCC